MPSPFPGMDPYLEKHWGDVHHRLITYASDQLQPELPNGLRARVEERLVVETGQPRSRSIYPDVRVVEHPRGGRGPRRGANGVAVAEPLVIELPDEPETQGFIEIREPSGGHLVTVVEVLSPSNKVPGEGQDLYRKKQRELLAAGVSLVEIDLLRGGDWVLAPPMDKRDPAFRDPYRVCVRRAWHGTLAWLYRIPLREKLPTIQVPLRVTDDDVPLNLQALIDKVYQNGGYDDIDYNQAPDPPLPSPERRWADQLLRKQGRRSGPRPKKKK